MALRPWVSPGVPVRGLRESLPEGLGREPHTPSKPLPRWAATTITALFTPLQGGCEAAELSEIGALVQHLSRGYLGGYVRGPMMRHPRLNEVLPALCRFPAGRTWWESSVQDLADGGVKLQTPFRLPPHCFLLLRFSVPTVGDLQACEIEVTTLNVWAEDTKDRHFVGLQFLNLSDAPFEHIRAYVHDRGVRQHTESLF